MLSTLLAQATSRPSGMARFASAAASLARVLCPELRTATALRACSIGWRAAVDDVRYVTTLQNLVDAGQGSAQNRARAKAFLRALSPDTDLDTQRRRCARLIVSLNA